MTTYEDTYSHGTEQGEIKLYSMAWEDTMPSEETTPSKCTITLGVTLKRRRWQRYETMTSDCDRRRTQMA